MRSVGGPSLGGSGANCHISPSPVGGLAYHDIYKHFAFSPSDTGYCDKITWFSKNLRKLLQFQQCLRFCDTGE
jgi:hypothetical protein